MTYVIEDTVNFSLYVLVLCTMYFTCTKCTFTYVPSTALHLYRSTVKKSGKCI